MTARIATPPEVTIAANMKDPIAVAARKLAAVGYTVFERLGRGTAGVVFRAHDPKGAEVALKVLHPSHAADATAVQRFLREAGVARRLNHPNLVRALDAGECEGVYYIAMEYVRGATLADLLNRERKLPEDTAVRIILDLCAGLQEAHEKNLIHRDIKPANVLVTEDGVPKLADMGLVKDLDAVALTRPNQGLGTPMFMAPEQFIDAKKSDARCDIYSLGVLLYVMVTGEMPFAGNDLARMLDAKMKGAVAPAERLAPSLSPRVADAITKAMACRAVDRPSSAAELAAMIADPATLKSHMATFVPLPDAATTDTASARAETTAADTEAPPATGTEIQSSSEFKATPRPASAFSGGVDEGTPSAEVWYVVWSKDMRLTLVETTAASIRKHLGSGKLQVHVTASRSPKGPFLPLGMIPEFKQAKRSIPTA